MQFGFSLPAAAGSMIGMPSMNARTYVMLAFQVPPRMADDAAGILIADGALGCEVSKMRPRSQRPVSRSSPVRLCAYFERITSATVNRLQSRLRAAGMLANQSTPEHRVLVILPGRRTRCTRNFTFRRFRRTPQILLSERFSRVGAPSLDRHVTPGWQVQHTRERR